MVADITLSDLEGGAFRECDIIVNEAGYTQIIYRREYRSEYMIEPTEIDKFNKMVVDMTKELASQVMSKNNQMNLDLQRDNIQMRKDIKILIDLLKEWQSIKIFRTEESWHKWVTEYGARVEIALAEVGKSKG